MTTSTPADGLLLLDKPAGYTSAKALARAKRFLAASKAGHTGTLDPFATGLLPLAFGEATKFTRFLLDSSKTYRALARLGVETSTGDPEGEIIRRTAVGDFSQNIGDVLASFEGIQHQRPPMHSAVRQGGVRLYELARQGIEVERPARQVTVERIELLSYAGDLLEISVKCSKGTYIRSLAEDVGRRLGCGATLLELRRTAIGSLRIEHCASLDDLENEGPEQARKRLLSPEILADCLPRLDLSDTDALALLQGKVVPVQGAGGEHRVYGAKGRFLGIARVERDALHAVRLMALSPSAQAPDFP